jgi:transcriptional regulator with XRE-family HTH domain
MDPVLTGNIDHLWERFGAAVRLARKGSGFSMKDVADRLGISVTAVSNLERGYSKDHQSLCGIIQPTPAPASDGQEDEQTGGYKTG